MMSLSLMGDGNVNLANMNNRMVLSASGYLALLQEDDVQLKQVALEHLLDTVTAVWHEIAEALPDMEALAEDTSLPKALQQLAAALCSRVFFHLEEPVQALRLALMAGEDFVQLNRTSAISGSATITQTSDAPYVERLVAAAVDVYIAARRKQWQDEVEVGSSVTSTTMKAVPASNRVKGKTTSSTMMDTDAAADDAASAQIPLDQLQALIDRLMEAACQVGNHNYALGIALEARETTKVRAILASGNTGSNPALWGYATQAAMAVVTSKQVRQDVLQAVADCWQTQFDAALTAGVAPAVDQAAPHLVRVYQCLHQAAPVSAVLFKLLQGTESQALLGLQLCFDLMDSGDQAFIHHVADGITEAAAAPSGQVRGVTADGAADNDLAKIRIDQALRVLTGGFSAELALSFLYKQSHADRLIMETLKKTMEDRSSGSRNSVLHHAAVMTHSYLYAGTTNDSFLRDYLDWMKKASNWAKFSATASLGVVHASHITEAMHLLQPYLPAPPAEGETNVSPTGGYAEGGSLYALGLIHGSKVGSNAEKRQETTEYLRRHLRASHANEVMSHGAALGVGLTAMGSADLAIVQELKEVLDTDSAVAGEAAGIAIGMVLVGTGAGNVHNQLPVAQQEETMEVVAELKNYARETQHEKIIRGIAMGLALMNFGQEENADATIEEMRSDRDPVMRYGAQFATALAYCGTGANKPIRWLLHAAVSDVSDDVRMAAVIGLAFVMFRTPHRVPELVKLLLESFNPHVRYASCMAVGIAMAGTGDPESVSMLEPMLEDMTDYVRTGALMGTAMIYMQQSDTSNGRRIRSFRERLMTVIAEKHQSVLTKVGAVMSIGILDAGGRNCSIVLGSRNGFTKMSTAVGLALWLQQWHWYPMMHMFSLALTPTYTIGLNKDFKFPKNFEIQCNGRPSMFAYPKKLEEKKEEKKKRVETVTLSTTVKEKARLARKRAKMGLDAGGAADSSMDVEKDDGGSVGASKKGVAAEGDDDNNTGATDAMDIDKVTSSDESKKQPGKKKREPEPTSFRIGNPSRITLEQSAYCVFDLNQRYRPIRTDEKPYGVIILTDSTPEQEEDDLGAVKSPSLEPEGELAPPEPFDWTPPPLVDLMAQLPTATAAAAGASSDSESKPNDDADKPSSSDDDDEGGADDEEGGSNPMDEDKPSEGDKPDA